jgi:GGDEF domain-containing protein
VILVAILLGSVAIVGTVLGVVITMRRHGRLERELSVLRATSRIDSMTALRNAQGFDEDLDRELLRADRTGRPLAVVVFAMSADAPGGLLGDDAHLREVAKVFRTTIRTVDAAYRTGQAEFALILPETRAEDAMGAVARSRGRLMGVGIGDALAGVAESAPGISREELLAHAFGALRLAGVDGRPGSVMYEPGLDLPPLLA